MEKALVIYTSTTAAKYVDNYQNNDVNGTDFCF